MKPVIAPSHLMQDDFTGDYDEQVRMEIAKIRTELEKLKMRRSELFWPRSKSKTQIKEITNAIQYYEDQLKRYEE